MDAKELTKAMYDQQNKTYDHAARIEYLEQEVEKLKRLVDFMQIDIKMLQNMKR